MSATEANIITLIKWDSFTDIMYKKRCFLKVFMDLNAEGNCHSIFPIQSLVKLSVWGHVNVNVSLGCVFVCVCRYVREGSVEGCLICIEYRNRSLKIEICQFDSNSVHSWWFWLVVHGMAHGMMRWDGCYSWVVHWWKHVWFGGVSCCVVWLDLVCGLRGYTWCGISLSEGFGTEHWLCGMWEAWDQNMGVCVYVCGCVWDKVVA